VTIPASVEVLDVVDHGGHRPPGLNIAHQVEQLVILDHDEHRQGGQILDHGEHPPADQGLDQAASMSMLVDGPRSRR
jgi:hypothetical protein